MEDIDPFETQPRQAALDRLCDRAGNAAEVTLRQSYLGADDRVGRLQNPQNPAEVLFGFAIAVLNRGVEVIDAGLERPRDGALLVGGIAAHHDAADRATAEAEDRELHSRATKVVCICIAVSDLPAEKSRCLAAHCGQSPIRSPLSSVLTSLITLPAITPLLMTVAV